jgi:putative ABC transport system ATP-binding protein
MPAVVGLPRNQRADPVNAGGEVMATDDGRGVVIVSHDSRLKEIADRVLWLEDGRFTELATMATDPVCGMAVEQSDTNPHLVIDGQTWWFCSPYCRDEWRYEQDWEPG